MGEEQGKLGSGEDSSKEEKELEKGAEVICAPLMVFSYS